VLLVAAVVLSGGCNSIMNGWLDPTVLGNFRDERTQDIRTALTVESSPWGIPGAAEPTWEDLVPIPREYPISTGDVLAIEIAELRAQFVPWQAQVLVDELGAVNIPKLGRVQAAGLTLRKLEARLRDLLSDPRYDLLKEPEVIVNALSLHEATYSIFGIGVSAATNAPLRAGTFPIRRPDTRILEAINLVGGLNEFVTEIYVFRNDVLYREGLESQIPVKPDDEDEVETPDSGEDALLKPAPAEPSGGESSADAEVERSQDQTLSPEDEIRELTLKDEPPSRMTLRDEREALKPQSVPKYVWIDGELVPNPQSPGAVADEGRVAQVPTFEAMQSTVDWARIAGERDYRIIRIPADALRAGDRDYNVVVRCRDVIRIVSGEIGLYYVMGQVNRPGPFAFNAEQVTLKSAIAAAGNLSPEAWPTNCTVYRRTGLREQMIQVDLDAIFAGKTPDFVIRRGDIINVGTSPLAPFLARLRAYTLPNPVSNLGYSFTYSRNFADIDSFSSKVNPANRPDKFPGLFP